MKHLLLFLIAPAAVSFIVQSILCCNIKNRILRHGTLILPIVFIVSGIITLSAPHGDIFSGLGVIASVFWFAGACCAVFGYGAAWVMMLVVNLQNKNAERRHTE